MEQRLTRGELERMTSDLVERLRVPFDKAVTDWKAKTQKSLTDIHHGAGRRLDPDAHGGRVRQAAHRGKEPHKGVNPDEVVAAGAALQAGVLKGEVKDILLLDVTPLSLGIETKGGVMTKLIERNTTIPTRRSEVFTTADDGQSEVDVKVFQGEREMTYGNKLLGNFQLVGIPPAPRGVPQIEVTFDIDANGIVNVSAKDRGTGKEQSMTITGGTALPKDDIDRMVREAEQYAEEDRRRREAAEAKNRAEQLVYQTEKSLKDYGDKIFDEDRSTVESALTNLKEKLAGDDTVAITSATEALQQASYKLAEAVYAQAQPGPGEAQAGPTTTADQGTAQGDGDVVDAEIIDEGDQDKDQQKGLNPHDPEEVTVMSVSRWDPFQDLLAIQDEMNQAFGRARQSQGGGRVRAPALDISERKDAYVVTVEVPGVNATTSTSPWRMACSPSRVSATSAASPASSSTTGWSAATAASAARSPCHPRCRRTPSRPRSRTGCSRWSCPRPRRPSRRRSPSAPAAGASRCRDVDPGRRRLDPAHATGEGRRSAASPARGDTVKNTDAQQAVSASPTPPRRARPSWPRRSRRPMPPLTPRSRPTRPPRTRPRSRPRQLPSPSVPTRTPLTPRTPPRPSRRSRPRRRDRGRPGEGTGRGRELPGRSAPAPGRLRQLPQAHPARADGQGRLRLPGAGGAAAAGAGQLRACRVFGRAFARLRPHAQGRRDGLRRAPRGHGGEGLVKIEAEGKPFDPERHEAVIAVEQEDTEPGMVVDIVRTGYELRGRAGAPPW